jgi:hypothetical protein
VVPASFGVVDEVAAVMPQVERLSVRQAMATLAPFNVQVEISGRGLVQSQWPPPGTPISPGTLCRLTLASPTARPGVSQ